MCAGKTDGDLGRAGSGLPPSKLRTPARAGSNRLVDQVEKNKVLEELAGKVVEIELIDKFTNQVHKVTGVNNFHAKKPHLIENNTGRLFIYSRYYIASFLL